MYTATLRGLRAASPNILFINVDFCDEDGNVFQKELKLASYNYSRIEDINSLIDREIKVLEDFRNLTVELQDKIGEKIGGD